MRAVDSVNEESGEITTNGRVPAGEYNIRVDVYDAVWDLSVESTVNIVIKHISTEAALSSGSMRFHGNHILIACLLQCFDAVGWAAGRASGL